VVFYFRFRNPASSPRVLPKVKEYLPRLLGAVALVLVARANLDRVLALLKGEPVGTAPADIWTCPQPARTAAAS
jgi:hypothetical protein